MLLRLLAFLTIFAAMPLPAMAATAPVTGVWMTEGGDGAVELYSCGDSLCGRLYWMKQETSGEATAALDDKNPDPRLRNRPLCGMEFMGGFTPAADGAGFTNGWIYSPRHGKKFSSEIRAVSASAIELRGYFLLPLLGQSQIWTRAAADLPACTPSNLMAGAAMAARGG